MLYYGLTFPSEYVLTNIQSTIRDIVEVDERLIYFFFVYLVTIMIHFSNVPHIFHGTDFGRLVILILLDALFGHCSNVFRNIDNL